MRTLNTFDLLDTRNTRLTNQHIDDDGNWAATAHWRGRKFKVTITDDGTLIDEISA